MKVEFLPSQRLPRRPDDPDAVILAPKGSSETARRLDTANLGAYR